MRKDGTEFRWRWTSHVEVAGVDSRYCRTDITVRVQAVRRCAVML
ncbi:MAG: hypothetical protein R2873_11360 [Caldilineaceae bacterium]